jgi:uncharacterized iron-regulated membrane protein
MTVKKLIGTLHLWLGLASGLVVFIIAVTGCLYAFQDEIQNITQPYRFVEPQPAPYLKPSELKRIAVEALPDKKVHAVLYGAPGKSTQVQFYNYEPTYYYLVFINPYTGALLKVKDEGHSFFYQVLQGHYYLWLPPTVGQPITATATLIFVAMLITGLVLWWPKNKASSRQRFTIKWSARWRRKNYDLHNVAGFYVFSLALLLAVTGLVWGFQWVAKSVYTVAGGQQSLLYQEPPSDTTVMAAIDSEAIDKVWNIVKREAPHAATWDVHVPETKASPVLASVNQQAGTYWKTDYRYFDQYSLKELKVDNIYGRFNEARAADKLIRMNYDIHVGAIAGLPGKVIAFLASALCASLPVTGFVIWWGRRFKPAARK